MLRIGCKHSEANELLSILSFIDSLELNTNLTRTSHEEERLTDWQKESMAAEELSNLAEKQAMEFCKDDSGYDYGTFYRAFIHGWASSKAYYKSKMESYDSNVEKLDDLAKEIDAVSKRYPEVSFAKLSRIAKHFAEWQKEQDIEFGISDDPEVQKAANYYCEQTKPGEVSGAEVWDAFIKGAEWQKKQDEQYCQGCFDRDQVFWKGMQHTKEEWMKEAVEGILVDKIDGTQEICLHDNRYGQKVKLIILKDHEGITD